MLLIPHLLCVLGLALGTVHSAPMAEMKLQRGNCPMFWYSFNDRCYKYVATAMTWGDAELNCVSQDANLVSIHSAGEHNFVRAMIKNYDPAEKWIWIGLTDCQREGGWMWSDGSRVSYTLWREGEPNNYGGNEHCGITRIIWNDAPCSDTYHFVCKSRTVSS